MRKIGKDESGQALVELALVLPILLLVVCGIIDFGWLFFNQLSMQNACREVARYTCVNSTDADLQDAIDEKAMENMSAGITNTRVTYDFENPSDPPSGDVTIKIEGKIRILTPVLGTILGGMERDMETEVKMKVEQ